MEIVIKTKFNMNDFVPVDGLGKCQVLGIRVDALKYLSHDYEPDIQYLVSPQDESKVKMNQTVIVRHVC